MIKYPPSWRCPTKSHTASASSFLQRSLPHNKPMMTLVEQLSAVTRCELPRLAAEQLARHDLPRINHSMFDTFTFPGPSQMN
jgi:hypothetical protein